MAERLLSADEIAARLATLDAWHVIDDKLRKDYHFPDFEATMAFVNAVAWVARCQDHHPDLAVGYGNCRVEYITHSAGGLTKRDFDGAAGIDALARL